MEKERDCHKPMESRTSHESKNPYVLDVYTAELSNDGDRTKKAFAILKNPPVIQPTEWSKYLPAKKDLNLVSRFPL